MPGDFGHRTRGARIDPRAPFLLDLFSARSTALLIKCIDPEFIDETGRVVVHVVCSVGYSGETLEYNIPSDQARALGHFLLAATEATKPMTHYRPQVNGEPFCGPLAGHWAKLDRYTGNKAAVTCDRCRSAMDVAA